MTDQGDFPWLAQLFQVTDSAFPTGSYAHSYGFEQVVRMSLVHDADSMAHHLEQHLWPMLIHFELPVVRFAQEAALCGDDAALTDLAACVDATKTAQELREASRATGHRRLRTFCELDSATVMHRFAEEVEKGRSHSHHAIVYGIGMAKLPQKAVLTSWAFQSLSAVCLSAPKLFRIGQNATQRVLTSALSGMENKINLSLAVSLDEFGWFDPLVEIASMEHEIAYERLFIS
jgi:urease accessory protein